jgi:putative ATP-dependent endonuclease of the OLD family
MTISLKIKAILRRNQMLLRKIMLKNYRNFIDSEIVFNDKTLIIGANDVGKTNILDAIRFLLDKSLSENDLEPAEEDFCAFYEYSKLEIILHFTNVTEDCIHAKFGGPGGYISEENEFYLAYFAYRDGKKYEILAGPSIDELQDIKGRFYLKVLNLKYVGANRQIDNFLKNQKNHLLEKLKSTRTEEQDKEDNEHIQNAIDILTDVQGELDNLSFINSAGTLVNKELRKLAEHHVSQEVRLGVDIPKSKDLFRKVQLLSYINDQAIQLGGDGRKNQVFIALWAALNVAENVDGEPDEVSIFCIEEPEAHLHPHQQRKLSQYLVNYLKTQVILTSHSPFIASEFQPESIVRLYTSEEDQSTLAAQKGVSEKIGEKIENLEFRINVISSEVYFSDCVFLVEGSSEVVFYKALAHQLGIDLDRLNISILSVEGVGFQRYIELFDTLDIPWVIRTDNDMVRVSAKKKGDYFCLAGVQRAIKVLKLKHQLRPKSVNSNNFRFIEKNEDELTNLSDRDEKYRSKMYTKYYEKLNEEGIFISKIGLEEDLFHSSSLVRKNLREFFKYPKEDYTDEEVIEKMKDKKSTYMYHFVNEHYKCLSDLEGYELSEPLFHCEKIIKELRDVQANRATEEDSSM